MIAYFVILATFVVYANAACEEYACDKCFDDPSCDYCKGGFFGSDKCQNKGTCGEAYTVSEFGKACCNRLDCHTCYDHDDKCTWCLERGTFDECRAIEDCQSGFWTNPSQATVVEQCGTLCKTLDCDECIAAPECTPCKRVLGAETACKASDESCPLGFLAQNEPAADLCQVADPCAQHDQDCDTCLKTSGCDLCGYDNSQRCRTSGQCPTKPLRFSCNDCRDKECAQCKQLDGCHACISSIGIAWNNFCDEGTDANQCTPPVGFGFITQPVEVCTGEEMGEPISGADSCDDQGKTCSDCIGSSSCKWCEADGFGRCRSECLGTQTQLTNPAQCDNQCAPLGCAQCSSQAACSWCGPPTGGFAGCVKKANPNSADAQCPVNTVTLQCTADGLDDFGNPSNDPNDRLPTPSPGGLPPTPIPIVGAPQITIGKGPGPSSASTIAIAVATMMFVGLINF